MIPFSIRIRDWLADHFSFVQYAVPRANPSNALKPATSVTREAVMLAVGVVVILGWIYRQRNDPGMRVFALFVLAFCAWQSTRLFVFIP